MRTVIFYSAIILLVFAGVYIGFINLFNLSDTDNITLDENLDLKDRLEANFEFSDIQIFRRDSILSIESPDTFLLNNIVGVAVKEDIDIKIPQGSVVRSIQEDYLDKIISIDAPLNKLIYNKNEEIKVDKPTDQIINIDENFIVFKNQINDQMVKKIESGAGDDGTWEEKPIITIRKGEGLRLWSKDESNKIAIIAKEKLKIELPVGNLVYSVTENESVYYNAVYIPKGSKIKIAGKEYSFENINYNRKNN